MKVAEEKALVIRASLFADKRAFGRLVETHQGALRRFLKQMCEETSSLTADDIAQEAFIKAWENINFFKLSSSFKTWLFRIAYNCFYDYQRANKSKFHSSLDSAEKKISYQKSDAFEINHDIYRALKVLSKSEKECIVLFYLEEQKQEDIAKITEMPLSTVKSHIKRGKEKLSNFLKQN